MRSARVRLTVCLHSFSPQAGDYLINKEVNRSI